MQGATSIRQIWLTSLHCSILSPSLRIELPAPAAKHYMIQLPPVSPASSCTTLFLAHNVPASLASLLVLRTAKPLSAHTALLTALARVAQSHPSHLSSNVTDTERPFLTV